VSVHALPSASADVATKLEAPTMIQVIELGSDGWVLIGRAGTRLGYVPSSAVEKLR
jgi:hypothetical protein